MIKQLHGLSMWEHSGFCMEEWCQYVCWELEFRNAINICAFRLQWILGLWILPLDYFFHLLLSCPIVIPFLIFMTLITLLFSYSFRGCGRNRESLMISGFKN